MNQVSFSLTKSCQMLHVWGYLAASQPLSVLISVCEFCATAGLPSSLISSSSDHLLVVIPDLLALFPILGFHLLLLTLIVVFRGTLILFLLTSVRPVCSMTLLWITTVCQNSLSQRQYSSTKPFGVEWTISWNSALVLLCVFFFKVYAVVVHGVWVDCSVVQQSVMPQPCCIDILACVSPFPLSL